MVTNSMGSMIHSHTRLIQRSTASGWGVRAGLQATEDRWVREMHCVRTCMDGWVAGELCRVASNGIVHS